VDDVTWGALALALTMLGGFYTWWTYHNRGATPAMRALALTLLPAAAWLTGTLKMFTRIVDAVVDWATHLVFSPAVWLGVILAGISAMLFVVSGFLGRRASGDAPGSTSPKETGSAPKAKALPRAQAKPASPLDDDGLDDEIAAILKRRGIS
jgi:hypothetical protein